MRGRINSLTKKELGYLLGLYIGDGYSNYNKKSRHYRVEFHLHSERNKDIIKYLGELLFKLNFNVFKRKDKRCYSIKTFVNCKEFMSFINKEVDRIKNKKISKEYKLGLLSGFIDAEGFVKKGDIILTQKNKDTLNFFKEIAKQLNVEGKMWWSKGYERGNGVWRLRISTRFKYHPHNSLKVRNTYCGTGCLS